MRLRRFCIAATSRKTCRTRTESRGSAAAPQPSDRVKNPGHYSVQPSRQPSREPVTERGVATAGPLCCARCTRMRQPRHPPCIDIRHFENSAENAVPICQRAITSRRQDSGIFAKEPHYRRRTMMWRGVSANVPHRAASFLRFYTACSLLRQNWRRRCRNVQHRPRLQHLLKNAEQGRQPAVGTQS